MSSCVFNEAPGIVFDMNDTVMKDPSSLFRRFSGAYGIVALPDNQTRRVSYVLAQEILGKDAEFTLSESHIPHLTLYHGTLENVPEIEAQSIVDRVRNILLNEVFTLRDITVFGGNFLFWNVDRSSDTKLVLQAGHQEALNLSMFLDRKTPAKAISEEGLKLSDAELQNTLQYGHPLVQSLYRPHITLGFEKEMERKLTLSRREYEWRFQVDQIVFAKIGYPGRIEEIVY